MLLYSICYVSAGASNDDDSYRLLHFLTWFMAWARPNLCLSAVLIFALYNSKCSHQDLRQSFVNFSVFFFRVYVKCVGKIGARLKFKAIVTTEKSSLLKWCDVTEFGWNKLCTVLLLFICDPINKIKHIQLIWYICGAECSVHAFVHMNLFDLQMSIFWGCKFTKNCSIVLFFFIL